MARTLRPGVLMTAYLVLFLVVGPWPNTHGVPATAHALARDASLSGFAIAAFLSWRVTRGSSFARGLLLVWTILGFAGTFMSQAMQSGSLVPCWLFAGAAGQLALLLSAPVYDRTRRDPADRYPAPWSLWPAPPHWMLPGAGAIAVVCVLLGLGSMSPPVLGPGCGSAGSVAASCLTLSQGYPVHFLTANPVLSLQDGVRPFLSSLSGAVISSGALAEDLALFTLAAFAAMYLLWLPQRRPDPARSVTALAAPDPLAGH
jgi:hypothetical protein